MADERTIAEIIDSQISLLPSDIRDMVVNGNWRSTPLDIGKKYTLHIDQIGELEQEVFLVMVGLQPSQELVTNLLKHVDPRRDVVSNILKDLNNLIFAPMKDFLVKMNEFSVYPESAGQKEPHPLPEGEDVPSRDDLLREIEEVGEHHEESGPAVITMQPMAARMQESVVNAMPVQTPAPAPVPASTPVATPTIPQTVVPQAPEPVAPTMPVSPAPVAPVAPLQIPVMPVQEAPAQVSDSVTSQVPPPFTYAPASEPAPTQTQVTQTPEVPVMPQSAPEPKSIETPVITPPSQPQDAITVPSYKPDPVPEVAQPTPMQTPTVQQLTQNQTPAPSPTPAAPASSGSDPYREAVM